MKLSRELKVGFIAILALAALYWGLNYLKGSNLFDNHRYFYAIYSRIDGLKAARPVNINGFQVGQVDEIYFHPNNTGQLVVKIAMTNDFAIPRDSKARIYSSDLLGEKAIELDLGRSTELAAPGDTLISDIQLSLSEEVNKQVAPIKEKAEKLIGSIDTVMILASGFLTEETKSNFTRTFESIRRSFATLEHSMNLFDTTLTHSRGGLEETVNNLAAVTRSLKNNREKLESIFSNLDQISDSLTQINFQQTFAAVDEALIATRNVMEKVDEGEGSLGKLVNDAEIYQRLNSAAEQMNLLLLDLRYNPKRYVNFSLFGSSKAYTEEEIRELEAIRQNERDSLQMNP